MIRSLTGERADRASGLAGELPISRQAVAKHLAALDRAGLVAPRREGRETRYSLTPEPLGDAIAWMEAVGAALGRALAGEAQRRGRGGIEPTRPPTSLRERGRLDRARPRAASPPPPTPREAQQVLVDQRAQRRRVPERRHAADRDSPWPRARTPRRPAPPARRTPRACLVGAVGAPHERQHRLPPADTSDFTIAPTSTPTAAAASGAVRVESGSARLDLHATGAQRLATRAVQRAQTLREVGTRSATSASVSGKWQAARLPPSFAPAAALVRQISCAFQQRVWKRQAGGGLVGDGTSPPRTWRFLAAASSGSATGTADISAPV